MGLIVPKDFLKDTTIINKESIVGNAYSFSKTLLVLESIFVLIFRNKRKFSFRKPH